MLHPLTQHLDHHHMSGYFDDMWKNMTSGIQDTLQDYTAELVGAENAQDLANIVDELYKNEVDQQKKKALAEVQKLIHGDQSQSSGPSFDFSSILSNFQTSPVVASIPGGLWTIAGVSALTIFLLLRK